MINVKKINTQQTFHWLFFSFFVHKNGPINVDLMYKVTNYDGTKEVQILYMLFLLHVPRLPSFPAS